MAKKETQARKLTIRSSLLLLLAFGAGTGLLVSSTQPQTIGLLGIVGFFLLVYGTIFSFFLLVYSLRQHQSPVRFRSVLITAILALAPVMLLALSSTSQLNALDAALVILFEIAAIFYVSRVA